LLEDVGVALPMLPKLVRNIEEIAAANQVTIAVVAHAGDGNTHPLVVYNAADADETKRAYVAFGAVMDLALELGGTITGEHGVGRLKKAWLPAYLGEDVMALTRRIKDALDPQGILNPGAVI
jgi:glycolate oxidase